MTFDDLILNPKSRVQLLNYCRQPTHALLLTGKIGVGLKTIAQVLAREIAQTNIVIIEPKLHNTQKTLTINIEDIRNLHELTRARRNDNFVIIIDDADQMTNDAPQAFLKLLEEPVQNIFYILTSHNTARLPETIRSRTQIIEILPPPADLVQEIFKISPMKLTTEKRAKIDFLGDRRPAEIARLLTDEEYFRNAAATMETAKNFVQWNVAARLRIVVLTTTREAAVELAENIAKLMMLTITRVKNPKVTADNLTMISNTIDNLTQNGNVRAQLTNLAVNL